MGDTPGRFLEERAHCKLGLEIVMAGTTSEEATTKLLKNFKTGLEHVLGGRQDEDGQYEPQSSRWTNKTAEK